MKKEIIKALNEKYWKKYRNFNIYISKKGLPEKIVIRPTSLGYAKDMNPMAFDIHYTTRKLLWRIIN